MGNPGASTLLRPGGLPGFSDLGTTPRPHLLLALQEAAPPRDLHEERDPGTQKVLWFGIPLAALEELLLSHWMQKSMVAADRRALLLDILRLRAPAAPAADPTVAGYVRRCYPSLRHRGRERVWGDGDGGCQGQ